jgi:CheY-like chemotaxis protein
MGARILVADDSVTIQKVVELTFSKEDFTLIQARSGEETLRKAKELRPDLILLDLVMPDRNGYDVCAALRAEPMLRAVPIILLAGTHEAFDQQRATQVGANGFVSKPFEAQVLIGKVKQLLFVKTVGGESAGAVKSSADAPTLKIPPVPPRPEPPTIVAPPAPIEAKPPQGAPAAAVAAAPGAQDDLWQLLDRPAAPGAAPAGQAAPSAAPSEPGLDELTVSAAPAAPEVPSLDIDSLGLELTHAAAPPMAGSPATQAAGAEALSLPESLSLDDLLGEGPEVPASAPRVGGSGGELATFEPVFELPATEAPPLSMVEAGTGEPPTLSVEELLGSPAAAPASSEPSALDVQDLDLTALSEEIQLSTQPSGEPPQPAAMLELESTIGLPLEETASAEADLLEPAVRAEALDFLPSIQRVEEMPGSAEPVAPAMPAEIPPARTAGDVPVEAAVAMAPTAEPTAVEAATRAEEATPPSGQIPAPEMAAMRQEVTARVAHDLTRELSEKLLERFEKIVWEVVPDLAELLISKEIERIRRLAEAEKQQSS